MSDQFRRTLQYMNIRKIAIRILFVSIAIAALAGFATLIAPSRGDIIARLVWTAVTTAIAATLLLVSIGCLESTAKRELGITLGLLVCAIYTCTIIGVWLDAIARNSFVRNSISQQFFYMDFILAMCAGPLLIGSGVRAYKKLRIAGRGFLYIWLLLALVWCAEIWFTGDIFGRTSQRFLIPLVIASPIVGALLIRWPSKLTYLGLVLACIGCVIMQVTGLNSYTQWNIIPLYIVLACGWGSAMIGAWNILTLRTIEAATPRAERATFYLTGFALGWICVIIEINEFSLGEPELVRRITAASTILSTTAIVGVLVRQNLKIAIFASRTSVPLEATCPRCAHALSLAQGKSRCPNCNLGIKIHVESTGCRKCGYNLSGIAPTGGCPGCGTRIAIGEESAVE